MIARCQYCGTTVLSMTIVVPPRFGYRNGMKVCLKPAVYAPVCPDCQNRVDSGSNPVGAATTNQLSFAHDVYQRLKGAT